MLTRSGVARRLGKGIATVRRMEGIELHPVKDARGVHRFDRAEVERVARNAVPGPKSHRVSAIFRVKPVPSGVVLGDRDPTPRSAAGSDDQDALLLAFAQLVQGCSGREFRALLECDAVADLLDTITANS